MMIGHYDRLGVSRMAPAEVIEAAWRALMKKHHPDKHTGKSAREAAELSKQINEAHDVLSDPKKRRAYDQWLDAQANAHRPEKSFGFPPPPDFGPRAYPMAYGSNRIEEEIARFSQKVTQMAVEQVFSQIPDELRSIIENALRNGGRR